MKLQSGDEFSLAAWKILCDISRQEFDRIYERLEIKIEEVGESFYNPLLKPLIDELEQKGVLTLDNGAKCIFFPK